MKETRHREQTTEGEMEVIIDLKIPHLPSDSSPPLEMRGRHHALVQRSAIQTGTGYLKSD